MQEKDQDKKPSSLYWLFATFWRRSWNMQESMLYSMNVCRLYEPRSDESATTIDRSIEERFDPI
jgi:hypothetical protein